MLEAFNVQDKDLVSKLKSYFRAEGIRSIVCCSGFLNRADGSFYIVANEKIGWSAESPTGFALRTALEEETEAQLVSFRLDSIGAREETVIIPYKGWDSCFGQDYQLFEHIKSAMLIASGKKWAVEGKEYVPFQFAEKEKNSSAYSSNQEAPLNAKLGMFSDSPSRKLKEANISKAFLCPLTKKIMRDPVICLLDSISYERAALTEYLTRNRCSPSDSRIKMKDTKKAEDVFITNKNLAEAINDLGILKISEVDFSY